MTRWRFLLTPRWLGYLALVVVFAIACVWLGNWQFDRRAEAREAIAKIDANYDLTPRPLTEVLDSLDAFDPALEWTPVTLHGRYLADDQLLARTRPLAGQPGFEVLTPLLLENGTVFVVDRGWLPVGSTQDAPDSVPAPPAGEVTVVARLKPGEPELPGRSAPPGQIATIHLPTIADMTDHPLHTAAYGYLVSETPAVAEAPRVLPRPVRDEGPHLSYALQWFVFGVLAFIGLGWAVRHEARVLNADDPEEQRRAAERERRRALKARTDAEEEDALLDAVNR